MRIQGKSLSAKEKETIVTLKQYFDRTKDDPQEQLLPSVERVVNALEIGIATVKRTMADYNRGVNFTEQEKIYRGRPESTTSSTPKLNTINHPGVF